MPWQRFAVARLGLLLLLLATGSRGFANEDIGLSDELQQQSVNEPSFFAHNIERRQTVSCPQGFRLISNRCVGMWRHRRDAHSTFGAALLV
jgi:hypothetical protein